MRRFALLLALPAFMFLSAPTAHADKPRTPRPATRAETYSQHDAHAAEHVTIAAEPCDTKELLPNTRLDYLHHGFLPIRVIVTNDSDSVISLDDARLTLIASDNTVIPAATDDELQRRLFSRKSAAGTTIPLPSPLPNITIHHPPVDKQILADDFDFGFHSTTVEPHSTASGYLYYDVRDLSDPVLENATFEVRKVHIVNSQKEFYSFEIPLHPTPAAPATMIAKPAKP